MGAHREAAAAGAADQLGAHMSTMELAPHGQCPGVAMCENQTPQTYYALFWASPPVPCACSSTCALRMRITR